MFEHQAFQWWYGRHAGARRVAVRCLLQCLVALALMVCERDALAQSALAQSALAQSALAQSALAQSASALADADAPLCDPDAVASGSQIECQRPAATPVAPPPVAPPPVVPADSGEAPMCDETGASVAARIVIPEVDRGRLEALPCDLVWALFGGKKLDFPRTSARWGNHRPPAEPIDLTLARADAALLSPLLMMPARAEPRLQIEPSWMGLGASPGHLRAPYRPPLHRSLLG